MTRRHDLYVGIDVHKSVHKVAMLPASGIDESSPAWRLMTFFDIQTNLRGIDTLVENMNRLRQAFSEHVGNADPLTVLLSIDDGIAERYLELHSLG